MHITWLGQNCFKIEGKTGTVLIDPHDAKFLRNKTDLVVLPRPAADVVAAASKAGVFVASMPGEYEVKDIMVEGRASGTKGETVFRLLVDGIHLGHLGSQSTVDEVAADLLEGVDIVMVPVGGGEVLHATAAVEAVNKLEPRMVLPMHYRESGQSKLDPVEKFCTAIGQGKPERVKKLSLTKSDLPHDETKIIILEA